MLKFGGRVFCQRCRAANTLENELCNRCGTRLMLVVEPSGMRFEDEVYDGVLNDEHLLERITTLENSLARLNERFSQILDLLLSQTRSNDQNRKMLDALIHSLAEAGVIDREPVMKRWRALRAAEARAIEDGSRYGETLTQILANYKGGDREAFNHLVVDGLSRIEEGKVPSGVKRLTHAVELDEDNAPLNLLTGALLFRLGRPALALVHLKRAVSAKGYEERARLLSGLSFGDVGEIEAARVMLRAAVEDGASCFAVHYALGRLAAAESDWRGALAEFKKAWAERKFPESYYLLGLAHYHLGQLRLSRLRLEKAVELDERYPAAHHLLGLVMASLGERDRARASYGKAASLLRASAGSGGERQSMRKGEPPLFFPKGVGRKRRLMTGADKRLDELLRRDATEWCASR